MPSLHDINGPSQLFRRYLCPGSAQQERPFYPDELPKDEDEVQVKPEKIHESARRGSLLHGWTTKMVQQKEAPGEWDIKGDVTDDDTQAVLWTANEVRGLREDNKKRPDMLELHEHSMDLAFLGMPRGGTADFALVAPPWGMAIDYKFGMGFVAHPRWNWQFKSYACGLAKTFGLTEVEVSKLQPALYEEDRMQSYTFDAEELAVAEKDIRELILRTEEAEAPLVPGPIQCQWCRARDICPARRHVVASMPMHLTIPEYLAKASPDDRGAFYGKLLVASDWISKAISTATHYAMEENMSFNGWQRGEGRKSRAWAEPEKVLPKLRSIAMDNDKDPDALEKRFVVSVSEAEKILGKSKAMKEKLSDLVVTAPGKPRLVPIKGGK